MSSDDISGPGERTLETEKEKADGDASYYAKHPDIRDIPGLRFPGGRGQQVASRGQAAFAIFFEGPTPPSLENRFRVADRVKSLFDAAHQVASRDERQTNLLTIVWLTLRHMSRDTHTAAWVKDVGEESLVHIMEAFVDARAFYLKRTHRKDRTKGFDSCLRSLDQWILLSQSRTWKASTSAPEAVAQKSNNTESRKRRRRNADSYRPPPSRLETPTSEFSSAKRHRLDADESSSQTQQDLQRNRAERSDQSQSQSRVDSTEHGRERGPSDLARLQTENRMLVARLATESAKVDGLEQEKKGLREKIEAMEKRKLELREQVKSLKPLEDLWNTTRRIRNKELRDMGVNIAWGVDDLEAFLNDLQQDWK
ncbi:hypothetical protein CkaCkLH20_09083 [Colletotrichum karsti]|uniref:Uncharacterized protein n=1 Tax=Colletotrichum karsti TaxID=1095194 RepID=A0A9P6LI49_9PEZI|nr:uncharacterized protein CkaCkLH20_09083 [Colletotrichum karsti]KAF9873270.1 hypothetical protein CkaCkLH20_09083 [Colletotrichum karsti]